MTSSKTSLDDQFAKRIVLVGIVSVVLLQRLAVNVGSGSNFSLLLPVWFGLALTLFRRDILKLNGRRFTSYLFAVFAIFSVSLAALVNQLPISWMSIGLFCVLYLLLLTKTDQDLSRWAANCFVITMTVVAAVAVPIFFLQYLGVHIKDPMAILVPESLLSGGFNTLSPITYGSSIFRSNGIVLLEPSIYAQYCALAVLLIMYTKKYLWSVPVLLLAMATAFSISGPLLLAIGMVCAFIQLGFKSREWRAIAAIVTIAVAIVIPTTFGQTLFARSDELNTSTSSGYFRYVAPYEMLWNDLNSPSDILLGHGAGSAQQKSDAETQGNATFHIDSKLIFEYGVVTGLIAILFIGFIIGSAPPTRWLSAAMLIWFATNGGLLQVDSWMWFYFLFSMHPNKQRLIRNSIPWVPVQRRHEFVVGG